MYKFQLKKTSHGICVYIIYIIMSEVYIVAASRTAVGSLGKSLKNISADKLGSNIISDVIKKSIFDFLIDPVNTKYDRLHYFCTI